MKPTLNLERLEQVEDTLASFALEGNNPTDIELEWMCQYVRNERNVYEVIEMMKKEKP